MPSRVEYLRDLDAGLVMMLWTAQGDQPLAYQRRTLAADALIASCYLAGINTRRVRRALKALFGGAVNKDTVKVKGDWDAWNTRSLAEEPIVRLILDGTVVRSPA
jgi:putative transposase